MSFPVNGINWTPQTAATHSQTQLNYLNGLQLAMTPPGPQLFADPNNALWLNFLGSGSIQQTYDDKLFAASQSFNVATCADDQVLNLAPISGTYPLPATYSTVYLTCVATSAGICIIPAGTIAQFGLYNFVTPSPVTIAASGSAQVLAVCSTAGPISAPIGSLTSFTTSITNLFSVTNSSASTLGSDAETLNVYRQRLISGAGTLNWGLQGCILALRALTGIVTAQVYFNQDTVNPLVLTGGYTIPPRFARILIQGTDVNQQLATTYISRMTAPTSGANSEIWVTLSNQIFPIYYDIATPRNIYVKIYYDPSQAQTSNWLAFAAADIVALNNTLLIGDAVNQQIVSGQLTNFNGATITGVTLSLNNITYSRSVQVNATEYPVFNVLNISQVSGP